MLRFLCFMLLVLSNFLLKAQVDIRPFSSHNQSPLIHSFGLPNAESGKIISKNRLFISSVLNLSSNSTNALIPGEMVYFDGEMVRVDLSARYGIGNRFELGINLPILNHSQGFLDSSIDGFHNFIGVTGGARSVTPRGQMVYFYAQDNHSYVSMSENNFGIGDISLELGFKLLDYKTHAMAIRSYLKLNNADKNKLQGSGTLDISFQFSGQIVGVGLRPAHFFYSLGYLRIGDGSLLEKMQKKNVVFGSLGLAVKATSWLVPKIQFDYHSRFYKDSQTQELGDYGVQFLLGADFILSKKLILTTGFYEDMKINNSPDFGIQLGLNYIL